MILPSLSGSFQKCLALLGKEDTVEKDTGQSEKAELLNPSSGPTLPQDFRVLPRLGVESQFPHLRVERLAHANIQGRVYAD